MKQPDWHRWSMAQFISLCLLMFSLNASAVIETYEFDNEAMNERYSRFTDELRCPKCQNQNLSGSNSPIAKDLRRELHRLIKEGKDDEQVVNYMVDRYGDFILYRPRFNAQTALLWVAPILFFVIGLCALIMTFIKQRKKAVVDDSGTDSPLDVSEQDKLDRLLNSASEVNKNG